MIDLATYGADGPVLLKDIAKRQQILERYLEQLVLMLKSAGLVRSTRDAHGGFTDNTFASPYFPQIEAMNA